VSDTTEATADIEVSSEELRAQGVPLEVIRWHEQGRATKAGQVPIIEHYLNCLEKNDGNQNMAIQLCAYSIGESHVGVGITDNVFIQDQNRHGRSILDRHNGDIRAVERLRKALARNGYSLKSDDHYIPTVARYFGDPAAIVNQTNGLGGLRRNLEEQGRTVEGEIEIKAHENGLPQRVKHKLNPKIVERIRRNLISNNPDLAHKDQRELRESIIDKHGQKVKKG
jgi:hypothetical protein